ncbi:hypothetical protein PYCCODRAFT_381327 [Trametes coccinea BRFM310]|uniref:Uncharacterized protein n=1 Tax=Trametes coccinea (strain BRFM310) TaxID=1353009 RepID=A0A1Y2J3R5_TRAC3|nr:hypothetical protein PYCCODRAFT_381327 [Trametes coccinea BRFM310]
MDSDVVTRRGTRRASLARKSSESVLAGEHGDTRGIPPLLVRSRIVLRRALRVQTRSRCACDASSAGLGLDSAIHGYPRIVPVSQPSVWSENPSVSQAKFPRALGHRPSHKHNNGRLHRENSWERIPTDEASADVFRTDAWMISDISKPTPGPAAVFSFF